MTPAEKTKILRSIVKDTKKSLKQLGLVPNVDHKDPKDTKPTAQGTGKINN